MVLLPQSGGEARQLGGDWVGQRGCSVPGVAEAVGTAQAPSLMFHWLTHPSSIPGLGNRRGRSRTRLFVLSGKPRVGPVPWEEGTARRGSHILGPSLGRTLDAHHTVQHSPRGGSQSSPTLPHDLSEHLESCSSPTPAPCLLEASSRAQNRGPVQLSFLCILQKP